MQILPTTQLSRLRNYTVALSLYAVSGCLTRLGRRPPEVSPWVPADRPQRVARRSPQ